MENVIYRCENCGVQCDSSESRVFIESSRIDYFNKRGTFDYAGDINGHYCNARCLMQKIAKSQRSIIEVTGAY